METHYQHLPAFTGFNNNQFVQTGNQGIYIDSANVQVTDHVIYIGNEYIFMINFPNLETRLYIVTLIDFEYIYDQIVLHLQNLISNDIYTTEVDSHLSNSLYPWKLLDFANFKKEIETLAIRAFCQSG